MKKKIPTIAAVILLNSFLSQMAVADEDKVLKQTDEQNTVTLSLDESETPSEKPELPGISLGKPGHGGNGCPTGSAYTHLNKEQTQFNIYSDELLVKAGGETGRRISRKSCNLAFPIHVPQGISIALGPVKFKGFVDLKGKSLAKFSSSYFIAGMKGSRFSKTFKAPYSDDFTIEEKSSLYGQTWSRCGADVNLRVNTVLIVRAMSEKGAGLIGLETFQVGGPSSAIIRWKRCS